MCSEVSQPQPFCDSLKKSIGQTKFWLTAYAVYFLKIRVTDIRWNLVYPVTQCQKTQYEFLPSYMHISNLAFQLFSRTHKIFNSYFSFVLLIIK